MSIVSKPVETEAPRKNNKLRLKKKSGSLWAVARAYDERHETKNIELDCDEVNKISESSDSNCEVNKFLLAITILLSNNLRMDYRSAFAIVPGQLNSMLFFFA